MVPSGFGVFSRPVTECCDEIVVDLLVTKINVAQQIQARFFLGETAQFGDTVVMHQTRIVFQIFRLEFQFLNRHFCVGIDIYQCPMAFYLPIYLAERKILRRLFEFSQPGD